MSSLLKMSKRTRKYLLLFIYGDKTLRPSPNLRAEIFKVDLQ